MMEVLRTHSLKGEPSLDPDRESLVLSILLGCIARGRTIIDNAPRIPFVDDFSRWLSANQFQLEHRNDSWIIEGSGLRNQYFPIQELPQQNLTRFLAFCMLSADHETWFDFGSHFDPSLLSDFRGKWDEDRWQFGAPQYKVHYDASGVVPYWKRMQLLLQALLHETPLFFAETGSARDSLSGLMQFFGAPISFTNSDAIEMDELARRMARLAGQKQERKQETRLEPCKFLTGKELALPTDTTEASLLTLLACVLPSSEIQLKNVCITNGRASFFQALRRMGANVELTQRKDKFGISFATVKAQTSKRLQGRKHGLDLTIAAHDEIPLLAVAASLAEGETILRLTPVEVVQERTSLELLVQAIKSTGAEVGLYEEGLVIRGREELDSGTFLPNQNANLILAMLGIAKVARGKSQLDCTESLLLYYFPAFKYLLEAT